MALDADTASPVAEGMAGNPECLDVVAAASAKPAADVAMGP
jgi:hypothetical protein